MNDRTRSFFVLAAFVLIFLLAYWAHNAINDSYLLNEPEHVKAVEAANDSLETKISELREQNSALKEQIEDMQEEDTDEK
ncbi:hypothetical protein AYK24_00060 [Thermoplasmatales archaeon SG8-52-4]|nr:MAG: hypothetical protein AYK24_00060 [Thermoplasmatales archaeon SG8-52-4]